MTGFEVVAGKAVLKVFEWAWSSYGKELTDDAKKKLKVKFKLKSAAEAYTKKMKKRYDKMQLWKMSSPTSVEKIFTQVNILQKQSAFRSTPKEQLEGIYLNQAGYGEVVEEGKDGMEAVREEDRLFILGKPGAGKTTFLKHITLESIDGKFDALPIFVTLRELSESKQSLIEFVVEQFDICGFPEAQPFFEMILKQGKAIVLFDGLDEVNKEGSQRDKVIRAIKNFSDKFDQSKMVITCRVAAMEYNFEGFTYVEMADFDDTQIEIFVSKWFAGDKRKSEVFFKEFDRHAGNRLRDLAKNPLLLTLLCIGFEETLHFPERRSEIYEEALDALLKKRDSSRRIKRDSIYSKLSLGRKKQMFARIAAETFDKGEYLIEKKHLKKKIIEYLQNLPPMDKDEEIDGEAVIHEIEAQHGIFVERAKGLYSFAHLSFQEYYSAQYAVARPESRLPRLMSFVGDQRWREVFLLTVEMLDDADDFFDIFINQLDDYTSKVERLKALLIKGKGISWEQREFSLFLIVRIAQDLDCDLDIHLGIDLYFYPELNRALYLYGLTLRAYRTIILDRATYGDTGIDLYFTHVLARARDNVRTFTNADTRDNARKLNYECDLKFFEKAQIESQEKGYEACHQSLAKLSFPSEDASGKEWQNFADSLYEVFKATFCGEDYEFTKEEAKQVSKYFYATNLLLDCLNVAYVSDRAGIEDRLLRPPR